MQETVDFTQILTFLDGIDKAEKEKNQSKAIKDGPEKNYSRKREVVSYRMSIRPRWVTMTVEKEPIDRVKSQAQLKNETNLVDNTTKGQISKKSKNKLITAVDWVIYSSVNKKVYSMKHRSSFKFKVNFITLTIPPQGDGEIKEKKLKALINTWLTYHRKYSQLNNYVWKVEFHKDGRLHVHVIADTFIHYQKIRNSWNQILQRNGLLENHYKKFQSYDPNSTDVHSVKKVKKLSAYISKYMTKQNKKDESYTGRVWACSEKVSKALATTLHISPDKIARETKKLYDKRIEWKEILSKPDWMGYSYHLADVFFLKIRDWIYLQGTEVYNEFKETIEYLRPPLDKLQTNLVLN